MPLTTIELNNCAERRPWKRNRGYGDGLPPLLFLFSAIRIEPSASCWRIKR
jgi:hypothetical protein